MVTGHAAAPPRNPMNSRRLINCPTEAEETSKKTSIFKPGLCVLPCSVPSICNDALIACSRPLAQIIDHRYCLPHQHPPEASHRLARHCDRLCAGQRPMCQRQARPPPRRAGRRNEKRAPNQYVGSTHCSRRYHRKGTLSPTPSGTPASRNIFSPTATQTLGYVAGMLKTGIPVVFA